MKFDFKRAAKIGVLVSTAALAGCSTTGSNSNGGRSLLDRMMDNYGCTNHYDPKSLCAGSVRGSMRDNRYRANRARYENRYRIRREQDRRYYERNHRRYEDPQYHDNCHLTVARPCGSRVIRPSERRY